MKPAPAPAPAAAALLLAGAISFSSVAHDFWIEAAPFQVPAGGVVRVSLHHGECFMGEPVPRDPARLESFQLVGPRGAAPVLGRSGSVTGFARPEAPGLHVISYHSGRLPNELPADAFEAYLREKGLDQIAKLRAERGDRGRAGREVYSRCAKALIWAGELSAPGGTEIAPQGDQALGLPLEIVAEGNPCALHPGDALRVRLVFRGEPLPGAMIVAVNRNDPTRHLARPTDAQGRAEFMLGAPGAWMLSCVHMVAAPPDAGADWESFWASLTFEPLPFSAEGTARPVAANKARRRRVHAEGAESRGGPRRQALAGPCGADSSSVPFTGGLVR